jgi:hypothetical protein
LAICIADFVALATFAACPCTLIRTTFFIAAVGDTDANSVLVANLVARANAAAPAAAVLAALFAFAIGCAHALSVFAGLVSLTPGSACAATAIRPALFAAAFRYAHALSVFAGFVCPTFAAGAAAVIGPALLTHAVTLTFALAVFALGAVGTQLDRAQIQTGVLIKQSAGNKPVCAICAFDFVVVFAFVLAGFAAGSV